VFLVVGVEFGQGGVAGGAARNAGVIEHRFEVLASALRVGGAGNARRIVDCELHRRLGSPERATGGRDSVPCERVRDPIPVRKDQHAACIERDCLDSAGSPPSSFPEHPQP
jgi:hypothetical protein